MMDVPFIKMHGAGNDFVVVDEFQGEIISEKSKSTFVRKVSDRRFGVGCDGVVFVQKSGSDDARFVFYNPDGSKAEVCGNGLRCFAKFVYESGIAAKTPLSVESPVGSVCLELIVDGSVVSEVRVDLGVPVLKRKDIPVNGKPDSVFVDELVDIGGEDYRITAVGLGNPHAVLVYDDVDDVDVAGIGSKIRYHLDLFPKGVNVHFIEKTGFNQFKIRSYERGVEAETFACGSGISASAVAAVQNKLADPGKELIFHARGGVLRVELKDDRVYLTGPAVEVYRGTFSFKQ